MRYESDIQRGWDFAISILGADAAAYVSNDYYDYIEAIESAIKDLEYNINNHPYRNINIDQLQGYMLEEWAAGTLNTNAAGAHSLDFAEVMHLNGKDSVDIHLGSGADYSAKSYGTAEKTAVQQARVNTETGEASYLGQGRLVPEDQLDQAKAYAHRQYLRNAPIREKTSEAYNDAEVHMTDRLKNADGIESEAATRKELEQIARESKKQEFSADKHGITLEGTVDIDFLAKQALKAGYNAAVVTVAFQLAPEIYKAIDYLIKTGEIDLSQIKHMGEKGITSGAEGFIRGTVASTLKIMCDLGKFGERLKGVNPTLLGTVVALTMQTVKNSILVAAGRMTAQQMGAAFVDTVIVTGGYLLGAKIGGMIGQALGLTLPVAGYVLGTLVGTSFCVAYNIGKKKLISFCVDTGFTCFGLVEQNYELPEEVLKEIGVDVIPIPTVSYESVDIPEVKLQVLEPERAEFETIQMTVLKRGIIGVNKVGYVLA